MRKLVVTELLSLDGVAEAPDGFFGWDEAVDAKIPELIATQDAVILGRRTYDEWAQFWPSSQIEPFATFINGVEKYVATSTPLDQEWANSTVVDGGLVEFVRDLKHQPGRDIGVHGSISVAQALLAADVVDELTHFQRFSRLRAPERVLDVRIDILSSGEVAVDTRGMTEPRMVTPMQLECQECRLLSDEEARAWRMYRADDPDDPFADPLIASYCPDCAEREFGPLHPVRVYGHEAF